MRCLESVQHQALGEFELLLVDNSPDAELRSRIEAFNTLELLLVDNSPDAELRSRIEAFNTRARIPARYVAEPRLGLHNARHAGARAASGDVLVFTDDDAVFDSRWLAAYARAFAAHAEMTAAGGPVLPDWEAPPPAWLTALMQADPSMFPVLSLLNLSNEFQLTRDGIFFGVNMAVTASSSA
jgi:glycosyltransferase involved in cell wall biosynthesis